MYNTSQAGFYRPTTDFVPAVHEASLDIFNTLGPIVNTNQKYRDWMTPFMKKMNVAEVVKSSYTYFPTPPEYVYFGSTNMLIEGDKLCGEKGCDLLKDGKCIPFQELEEDFFTITTKFKKKSVTLIDDNRWAAVSDHETMGPSMEYPYIKHIDTGFESAPGGMGVVVFDYYRLPVRPVFSYDSVENYPDLFLNYKEEGSVHVEWSEALLPVFLYRLGKRYGLFTKDQLVLQVTNIDKIFL